MSGSKGRQHLRPWLISKINSGDFPGLEWINPEKTEFKIPWKHGSKHDWSPNEAKVFQEWARHTGKFTDNDKPDWVTWKTRLRCAFNKAPDIEEIKTKRCYEGQMPYRVYQFKPRHNKKSPKPSPSYGAPWPPQSPSPDYVELATRIDQQQQQQQQLYHAQQQQQQIQQHQNPLEHQILYNQRQIKSENPTSPLEGHDASSRSPVIPTMVNSLCASDTSMRSDSKQTSGAYSSLMNLSTSELLSTNGISFPISSTSNCSSILGGGDNNSHMDTSDATSNMGGIPAMVTNISPESSYQPQQQQVYSHHHQHHQQQQPPQQQYGAHDNSDPGAANLHQLAHIAATASSGVGGGVSAVSSAMLQQQMREQLAVLPHDNCPMMGDEMEVKIHYKNNLVTHEHILHTNGTRIYYGQSEVSDPEVMEKLRVERQDIMLPPPTNLLPEYEGKCIKYIDALLQYMQRGLIIECKNGDIFATRLCRTAAYYATHFTQESQKIERPENSPPQPIKIFDFAEFKKEMDVFAKNPEDHKTPSPDIHLFIGQKGTASQFSKVLICAQVWSCKAKMYCNKVLKEINKQSLSLEISDPNSEELKHEQQQQQQQQQHHHYQQQQHLQ